MQTFRSALAAARTPHRALRFGHATLLTGWVVFVLATTLSICIQAIGAPADPAQNITSASADNVIAHSPSDDSLAEKEDEDIASSCCHVISATPRNAKISSAVTMREPPSEGIPISGVPAAFPIVGLPQSEKPAQHDTPPAPRRLYLRTLHLLI